MEAVIIADTTYYSSSAGKCPFHPGCEGRQVAPGKKCLGQIMCSLCYMPGFPCNTALHYRLSRSLKQQLVEVESDVPCDV